MRFLIHDHESPEPGYAYESEISAKDILPSVGDLLEIGNLVYRVNTRRFAYEVDGGPAVILHVTKPRPVTVLSETREPSWSVSQPPTIAYS